MPRSSHRRTHEPATSWATRKETPRRTSHSAISVARANPPRRQGLEPGGVEGHRRDHPGEGGQEDGEGVDGVEDGLLVLLEVAVVGQREALEGGQQPREVADQPSGLPRASSATSGFFFCGMMLDPVE